MTKLPTRLSELLRLAVWDCLTLERDKGVRLDMHTWHEPAGKQCRVCMAGAIMDQRLNAPRNADLSPTSYPVEFTFLHAVDAMRLGNLTQARMIRRIPHTKSAAVDFGFYEIVVPKYVNERGRTKWGTYLEAADYLQEMGL